MLTTTSTGTRSARALLEARIVRRIPFPAFVEIKNNTLKYIAKTCIHAHIYKDTGNFIKVVNHKKFIYRNEETTWSIKVINPSLMPKIKEKKREAIKINIKVDLLFESVNYKCILYSFLPKPKKDLHCMQNIVLSPQECPKKFPLES